MHLAPNPLTDKCIILGFTITSGFNPYVISILYFLLVSFIRLPILIQRLQRTETNLIHFKWEVT